MSAITRNHHTPPNFGEIQTLAVDLAKARGFIPQAYIGNPGAIAACILTGTELGIGPMASLRGIHVIEGRPTLSADLMLALAIRAGVRAQWVETTADVARLRLERDGFEPHQHEFSMADAKRAGLARRQNWGRDPAAMFRARCLSAALRAWCPDVLGGGVFVEGEIEPRAPAPVVELVQPDDDDDALPVFADVVDSEPEPEPRRPIHAEVRAADAPDPRTRAIRLSECRDAGALRVWCESNREAIIRSGTPALARVVAAGEEIGASPAEVRSWLGVEHG
jgi:hypothetical protein